MERYPYVESPMEGKPIEDIEKSMSEPIPEEKTNDEKKTASKKNSKQLQRLIKKQLNENPKMSKDPLQKYEKAMKREEFIKNVVVKIDETVLLEGYGEDIKSHLKNNGVCYRSISSKPGLISWTKKAQNTIVGMFSNETEIDEEHYFLIIPCSEFRKDVRENRLKTRIQFIHENVELHHLCIAVIGTDKLTDEEEYAVMDVEFSFNCFWRFLKKSEDLVSWLMMATKSVAEIPYKFEQEKKYELQKQFFDLANRDTVRVDKNGNGLDRLWRQILTVFPLVNLETAEAIAAVYSSPTALYKAYTSSTNPEEMLQDIPIRRAHGPLTSVRKIGPELSKKIYKFFTAEENVLL